MPTQAGKSTKRYKPNYIYSIISVALVLYLLGTFGFIIIHTQKLTTYFKENIIISVELKDHVNSSDRRKLQKLLEQEKGIKKSVFVSKEDAANRLEESIKEEFVELLGHNPLYDAFELNIYADYAREDSLNVLESTVLEWPIVKNIHFDNTLIKSIDIKTKMVGAVILGISIILLLITLTLINSTIRLSMYSQRFLIKSQQLVGATSSFIIRPFVSKAVIHGLFSGIIASIGLAVSLYYAQSFLPELEILQDIKLYFTLVLSVLIVGILISWISTIFSVKKYLGMKLDALY
tara:strand:+ start:6502 stop:7374 length:873 start_codon:yes stop_codon:yes gene_type:complete